MKTATASLMLLSAVTALAAAYFWFRSSRGDVPAEVVGAYLDAEVKTTPLRESLRASMRANRWAATFAAVAALYGGLASLLQALDP